MSAEKFNACHSGLLNEWGIPDWRDKMAYGEVTTWTFERWRWEFYRRREDLRTCFDENADATHRENQRLIKDPRYCLDANGSSPNERGFGAHCPQSRELFGYVSIPNPRIGDQPQGLITPYEGFWHLTHVFDGSAPSVDDYFETAPDDEFPEQLDEEAVMKQYHYQMQKFGEARATRNEEVKVLLTPNDVAIKFELDKPLGPQLDRAKAKMKNIQQRIGIKTTQKRRHPEKWLGYLRLLDAKEAKTTWAEMVDVLYTDETLRPWKSTKRRPPPPPPHTARDQHKQAKDLCFNF